MSSPVQVTTELQLEGQTRSLTLPQRFTSRIKTGDTTPSVKNVERWICQNVAPVTIVNFKDGQEGQELKLLGDGFTSLAQNAQIVLNGGAGGAVLLAANTVYELIYFGGIWYGDDPAAGGGGGGGGPDTIATTLVAGDTKVDNNSGGAPVALTSAGHGAAADPHTQYQLKTAKDAASGYAGLDAGTKLAIAEVPTGATGATVCIGNDARLSDARTPTGHHVSHEPGGGDPLAVDAVAATGSLRTLGAGAQQSCGGTDTRLSDSRTPLGHHTSHEPGGSDPMAVDTIAATASLRTLGAGAQQAAAGTDTRFTDARTPTAHATTHQPGGSDAMVVDAVAATGSLRTLGAGAQQATSGTDSRLSDARTPVAHKTSHQSGGSDEISVAGLHGLLGDPQTPLAHTHVEADVTNLVSDLAGKAQVGWPSVATDPGSVSLSADADILIYLNLTLSGTERATATGNSRIVCSDFGTLTPLVLGKPRILAQSFLIPAAWYLDIYDRLTMLGTSRITAPGTAQLIGSDDTEQRSRLIGVGRG